MNRPITRSELTEKVLAAVRQYPGCDVIKEVSITTVTCVNNDALEWHISVVDPGGAERNAAFNAAQHVRDRLSAKYQLIA